VSAHSLSRGLVKYALASAFVRTATPRKAFPDQAQVRPRENAMARPVPTPELMGRALYPPGRYLQKPFYQPRSCYGMILPGILFDPAQGVILDGRRRAIEDAHQLPMRKHWYDWKPFFSQNIRTVTGGCFVFRLFRQSIYHLLTEHLPALYMLGQLPWPSDEPIKLLLPLPHSPIETCLIPRLCPQRVVVEPVEHDQLLRLERCYFVSQFTSRGCGYLPEHYLRSFLERVAPARARRRDRRIYISRSGSGQRRILNEKELVHALRPYGFESYALENMAIEDQIELFHDAEFVVAPHGAGLVNLLYAQRAKVLELFAGPTIRPHYYFLSKAAGHEHHFLLARERASLPSRIRHDFIESFNGALEDFSIDIPAVIAHVRQQQ